MRQMIAILLAFGLAEVSEARTLFWRVLDVNARLEATGELNVRERHTMVFDGDWNGGERVFRVPPGQSLVFRSIRRVEGAREIELKENNPPARVDEFAWAAPDHIRWRVRAASDPPLRNREITYVLEYALRNIVAREGDHYSIDHDFTFEGRPGIIEHYTLKLELDPAWQPVTPDVPLTIERTSLPPGENVIGRFDLKYAGAGAPEFVAAAQPPPAAAAPPEPLIPAAARARWSSPLQWMWKLAALMLFAFIGTFATARFIRREESLGRYEGIDVNRAWLQRNILTQRPEVLGTAWDNTTSQPEVSALIAMMIIEGKIEQSGGKKNPVLRLLVRRESLSEYERAFVERLFIAGDQIDPATLRRHYSSSGFNPAAAITATLGREAKTLVGSPPFLVSCIAGIVGALTAFNVLPVIGAFGEEIVSILAGIVGAIALPVTVIIATSYRRSLRGRTAARAIAIPAAVFAGIAVLSSSAIVAAVFGFISLLILLLGFILGRWNGTPEQLRNLMNIRAARDYFKRVLERGDAPLEDAWIPYILAFGLGEQLDRWSVAAPSPSFTPVARTSDSHSTAVGSSGAASQFGGGGGRFGGGGATGSWASLGSFAAGVPSPSSSSSSGSSGRSSGFSSGSSGGSRSGGGRGGGW